MTSTASFIGPMPLRRGAIVLSIALAAVAGARAQSFGIPVEQFELDNGLRVVLSADNSAPVVAVAVYYDVGSRNETKGRSGFAHLFEHMMFQGSENVGKAQHFTYVENNGGYLNGSTHVDYTNYYQFLPSNQLELALWLESDRMRSLKITPENLENQKEAVKEEKRLSIDNQAYWPALTRMDEMVFRNWANSHPIVGSMEDLDAATVDDVKRFFDLYYVPNNAVLVIAGDFDVAGARSLVAKYFGPIPRGKEPPPVDVSEPQDVARAADTVADPLASVPAVAVSWKIPERRSRDFYAIALLHSLLFDRESARLYRELVHERELALNVEGFFEPRRGPGAASVFCIHRADAKSEDVWGVIQAEIERVKAEGPSAEELTKLKNQYRLGRFAGTGSGSEYESLQTALGRAMALGEHALFDGDPSLVNTEIDRYLAVTAEQIRDAARSYFGDPNRSVLFIRPKK